ncbi:NYN domain-containing protein [Candidatus Sulfurimonas marisnigri]|uniref:NYN domain-containing protein n=1 Tax=Candidatus Sulfurimonas marisnigri TaxID=2740405 RepID=A0A7S7LYJ8_9BACT|nr:NYN domain-containing protein [Candidatus Sulfurimonas marisnigri]QOY53781.1 NYN domain-containing protein [Candidatus Sulfurimonas marisnigri]
MKKQHNHNIAMFIDCDNVSSKYIESIFEDLSQYGTVNIRRAYGDWKDKKLFGWENVLQDYNIKPIQQFAYTKGKNATDIAMIIDIMDILYSKDLEAIVLITSDSDFTPIVTRILSDGLTVYGYGESKTPMPFVNACSQFIYVEKLSGLQNDKTVYDSAKNHNDNNITNYVGSNYDIRKDYKLINLIKQGVEITADEQGWADVKDISMYIRKNSSFSQINYGFKKMGDLIKALDLFDMEYFGERKTQLMIRIRDKWNK